MALDNKFDKEMGADLPMFSRTGKSTVSMYIAFDTVNKQKKLEQKQIEMGLLSTDEPKKKRVSKYDAGISNFKEIRQKHLQKLTLSLEDIDDYFNDVRTKHNFQQSDIMEMGKDQQNSLTKLIYSSDQKRDPGTYSFKAITREQRQRRLGQHPNEFSPHVGKYNPKFNQMNKRMMEDREPSLTHSKERVKKDEQVETQENQDLQIINDISRQTKSKNQSPAPQKSSNSHRPMTAQIPYNKSVLQQVIKFQESFGYENLILSPNYHIVQNKNTAVEDGGRTVFNQSTANLPTHEVIWTHEPKEALSTHVFNFDLGKHTGRKNYNQTILTEMKSNKDALAQYSQKNIDNISTMKRAFQYASNDPKTNNTSMREIKGGAVDFKKMMPRQDTLTNKTTTNALYVPNADFVLENRKKNQVDFKLMSSRDRARPSAMSINTSQNTIDYNNLIKAIDHLPHHKKNNAPLIDKQTSRDLSIYNQTDALKNIQQENLKYEYEMRIRHEQEVKEMKRLSKRLSLRASERTYRSNNQLMTRKSTMATKNQGNVLLKQNLNHRMQ